jgi:hypothetical protein
MGTIGGLLARGGGEAAGKKRHRFKRLVDLIFLLLAFKMNSPHQLRSLTLNSFTKSCSKKKCGNSKYVTKSSAFACLRTFSLLVSSKYR